MEKIFTHAIVRKPGQNFLNGITAANLGMPDYKKALKQHTTYCDVLKQRGLKLTILDSDSLHPDAPFVEDTVVIAGKSAVITRLGNKRRWGEEKRIRDELINFFNIEIIEYPGSVDGGDVLKIDNHYYIGISERTNEVGARQLANLLTQEGFTSSFIPVVNILHLKTGITFIGNNMLVAIQQFADNKEFAKFNKIIVDQDESYAANCLLVNENLFIPAGFPKTKAKIQELSRARNLIEVEMSEFEKMDGGLTCLSILF